MRMVDHQATTRARLLDVLGTFGGAPLTDLAERVGVSRPTARRCVDDLIRLDLVQPQGSRMPDRGRPAQIFGLAPGSSYVLGIDAGPRGSRVRIVSHTGRMVADSVRGTSSELVPSPVRLSTGTAREDGTDTAGAGAGAGAGVAGAAPGDGDEAFDAVVGHVLDSLRAEGIAPDQVTHTVMGVPGMVDAEGRIELSVVVPAWTGRHLGSELAARAGLPWVTVENDMGLMALGETHRSGRGPEDLVYVANHGTHRPGVVIDGVLRVGAHRMLGEGFVLETTGMVPSRIDLDGASCPYFEAARRIDDGELGPEWLVPFHEVFAPVIALLIFALDPDVVVIGGGPVTTSAQSLADLAGRLDTLAQFGRRPALAPGSGTDASLGGAVGVALHGALGAVLEVPDPPILPVRYSSAHVSTPGGHIHV
jgi:predicted NBD/HSP70 family sugar kinase